MSIPDYQTLMLPVLKNAAGRVVAMSDVADPIADDLGLTEGEREELLPSGRQRVFYNRLAWAKFYMVKAGLIDTPRRGRFTASAAGKELLAKKPPSIDTNLLKTYPAFSDFLAHTVAIQADENGASQASVVDVASTATPEDQIDAAYSVLYASVKADLLQRILDNTPSFFERLIVDLLVAMGYGGSHESAAQRLGKSGDGGIDGLIDEDRLGLDRIYVQAKRYALDSCVGRPAIQGFVGSLVGNGATKGVFVTTSTFSTHAAEYARHLPQRVILIDGERLCELMIEYGIGVRIGRTITVKRVDEDFFVDE